VGPSQEKQFQKFILLLLPLLSSPLTIPHGLVSVLGLMDATSRQVSLGYLRMRPIQQALACRTVGLEVFSGDSHQNLNRYARTHSVPPQAIVVIFTDASIEEWLFIAITILPRRAIIIPPYKCSGVQGCIQSPSDISSTNSASTVSSFRRKLKTYLFSKAFLACLSGGYPW